MLVRSFERSEEEIAVQLLDVKLGALAHSAPKDGTAQLMDFKHVQLGFFFRQSKDLLENHRHVTHQVDRVIVNDDLPGEIEFLRRASFLFDNRVFYR
jgi:hypothetical protein